MSGLFDKIKDCIDRDDVECLKQYVKTKEDANVRGSHETSQTITPLWYAIVKEARKSAEFLIDKGADVNFYIQGSEPVLVQLIKKNWLDLAQKTVENKLPITKETLVATLKEVLTWSGSKGFPSNQVNHFIDSLISHATNKKLTRYLNYGEVTELLVGIVHNRDFSVFKHFIDTYVPKVETYMDIDGDSVLHLATVHGYVDKVRYLVEKKKISPNITNRYGQTPLDLACRQLTRFEFMGEYDLQKAINLSNIIKYFASKNAKLETTTDGTYSALDILIYDGITNVTQLLSRVPVESLIQRTRVIVDLIKQLVQQDRLNKEVIKSYVPDISDVLLNENVRKFPKLPIEILMLPEKEVLLQALVSKLCGS